MIPECTIPTPLDYFFDSCKGNRLQKLFTLTSIHVILIPFPICLTPIFLSDPAPLSQQPSFKPPARLVILIQCGSRSAQPPKGDAKQVGYLVVWRGRKQQRCPSYGQDGQNPRRPTQRKAVSLERASGSRPGEKQVYELNTS